MERKNNSLYEWNQFATFAYDGIMVLALTLNKTEEILATMNASLREFDYSRYDIVDIMKDMITKTYVEGFTVGSEETQES